MKLTLDRINRMIRIEIVESKKEALLLLIFLIL
jgi:hypothetical protein